MKTASSEILKALAVTAELTHTELSQGAVKAMAADLEGFEDAQVLAALTRCRRELRSRLTVADVIDRIDDGRPGPEQAWGMIPPDEAGSVVWTEEMATAFGAAYPLMQMGERIPARMAFIEAYKREVTRARSERRRPAWTPCLGQDKTGREGVLLEAVRLGRLTHAHALGLVPSDGQVAENIRALAETAVKRLT